MKFKKQIKDLSRKNPNEETCGFLVLNELMEVVVVPAVNTHKDKKKYFKIDSQAFLDIEKRYKIIAIFHSHPTSSEKPSAFDLNSSDELCIPFLIYSLKTDKFFLHFPNSYEAMDIRGRIYIKDIHECTCLVKDYYKKELNIDISSWIKNYCIPEEPKKANTLLYKVFKKNLVEPEDQLKKHDIIVFRFSKDRMMHAGIYLGNEEFIHQRANQLSSVDFLDNRWKNKIYKTYRHPSLV